MIPAWYLARVRLPRAAFDPRLWWQLVRGGAPFLGSGIALTIRGQTGVLIVGALLSTQVAGWYFAAQRIAGIPAFIPVVLSTPLFPVLSRIAADQVAFRQTLSRTLVAALILTMLPCAMVIGFAPVIPDLLGWQASFAPSIPVMMLLALFIPCMAANVVVGTALIAINRERQWLKVGAAAAVVNPVLCVAAIPLSQLWLENGAIGLAVAEVVTEAFMLAGVLLILPRSLIAPGLAWLSVRIVLAGVGAGLTAMAVLPSSLILAVFASGLVYLVLIVGLRVVQLADVPTMRAAIREAVRPR
jgi:O-antigen/teichoic acid export membrane protein